MTRTTLKIHFILICGPEMSNTSCHGHKNVKMNNEMIDLNINPNKIYRNQDKITRG